MTDAFVPADLCRFVLAHDPQLLPDDAVIFRQSRFDAAADALRSTLWRVRPSAAPEPLTSGTNDRHPRVAPDGRRLAFVRDVDDEPVVHVLPLAGGEPYRVGEPCPGLSGLAWSPDGTQLAYVARADADAATAHIAIDEATGARHIVALPFKSDADGLLDGRRAHVFVLDLANGSTRQLTTGDRDAADVCWSPDGTRLAATVGPVGEATWIRDVVLIDVASGDVQHVTEARGSVAAPAFSPDGRQLAWLGHEHGEDPSRSLELFVADADGSNRRSLTPSLDRPLTNTVGGDLRSGAQPPPAWCTAHELDVLMTDGGSVSIARVDVRTGALAVRAGGEREIYAFASAPDGRIAFAYATPTEPSALALSTPATDEVRLTDLNPWLAEKHVVAPRPLAVRAADGTAIDAWLLQPEAPTPLPLVVEVHGGPHATYGHTFFFEFQLLAARGMAVVYGNPRGSQGYGHAFAHAVIDDWGGGDANDVHAIADAALASAPCDPQRVAVVGGSYGGFMTTWLVGHSDRFRTGISMRACNDFASFAVSTDISYFMLRELGHDFSAAGLRALFDASPSRAADRIDVPLLIMHSERDYRCPVDQGEGLFTILRMLGKRDVEFVRFTGDGHELSRSGKPRHRVLRLRAIAHWLERHLASQMSAPSTVGWLFEPLPGEAALPETI